MKKRLLSMLLILCLCIGIFPMSALASDEYSISICGDTWTASTYAITNEGAVSTDGASEVNYNIFWNAETAVLTLKDAAIASTNVAVISADLDKLTIHLVGSNSISATHELSTDFSAVKNEGEIILEGEDELASLSISVLQNAELSSLCAVAGIFTEAGVTNTTTLSVSVIAPNMENSFNGDLVGIQCGTYEREPTLPYASLTNSGKLTVDIQNRHLNRWYGGNSFAIHIHGGVLSNTGEIDLSVSTINGNAYGVRGVNTADGLTWLNAGEIDSHVIAYGGNYPEVPHDLFKASNHSSAFTVIGGISVNMKNTGTMNLTAENKGDNIYSEYAIGLELDNSICSLINEGTINCKALDSYTWGILLNALSEDSAVTNSGRITIEATADGLFDGEGQYGAATGIGMNMYSYDTNPVKTPLICEAGSYLSIDVHAVEGVENEEEITYGLCMGIQIQKIYYTDPGYQVLPQEIIIAEDLVTQDGGDYEGGEPLTVFLENYVPYGMYVYINTIVNYFINTSDDSEYSIPSKKIVIAPELTGSVSIGGSTRVDSSLSARVSGLPVGAAVTYQWQTSDTPDGIFTDIDGATTDSYTLTSDDLGKYVRVVVAPVEGSNYAGTLTATTSGAVSEKSSGGGGYVTTPYPPIITDTDGGNTTVNPSSPKLGNTVTIIPNPQDGKQVDKVTVTDKDGKELQVKDNGDGTYSFVQPNGTVTITVTYKDSTSNETQEDNCPSLSFSDLDTASWYHEYIDYAIENGLMRGTTGSLFSPNDTITRAQVVMVLWRLENEPGVNYFMNFEDVNNEWYAEAIRWAASEKVVDGYDGKFAPNDAVTREQLATILWRYAKLKGYDVSVGENTNLQSFSDSDMISEYAYSALQWGCGAELLQGNGDGILNPRGETRRSEFAAIIMRFAESVVTKTAE